MHALIKRAIELGVDAAKDKQLIEHTDAVIKAGDVVRQQALVCMFDLMRIFGAEKLAEQPRVGSEQKPGSNEPYDKVIGFTPTGAKDTQYFWNTFADTLPRAAKAIQDNEALSRDETIGESERKARKDANDIVKNNVRKMTKKGVNLFFKMLDVDAMEGVTVDFQWDKKPPKDDPEALWKGTLKPGNHPIKLTKLVKTDRKDSDGDIIWERDAYRFLSPDQFLALRLNVAEKAIEKGTDPYEALLSSNKRQEGEKDKAKLPDFNLSVLGQVSDKMVAFMKQTTTRTALAKLVNTTDESQYPVVLALASLYVELDTNVGKALVRKAAAIEAADAAESDAA